MLEVLRHEGCGVGLAKLHLVEGETAYNVPMSERRGMIANWIEGLCGWPQMLNNIEPTQEFRGVEHWSYHRPLCAKCVTKARKLGYIA